MRRGTGLVRVVRGAILAVGAAAVVAGCGDAAPRRVAQMPPGVSLGPVQPKPTQAGPLPDMQQDVDHSPAVVAALTAGAVVDARVLVISADGTDSELGAIEQTLGYLGTPFDVLIANQTTLTAAHPGASPHGKYDSVILARGNLALSNGT